MFWTRSHVVLLMKTSRVGEGEVAAPRRRDTTVSFGPSTTCRPEHSDCQVPEDPVTRDWRQVSNFQRDLLEEILETRRATRDARSLLELDLEEICFDPEHLDDEDHAVGIHRHLGDTQVKRKGIAQELASAQMCRSHMIDVLAANRERLTGVLAACVPEGSWKDGLEARQKDLETWAVALGDSRIVELQKQLDQVDLEIREILEQERLLEVRLESFQNRAASCQNSLLRVRNILKTLEEEEESVEECHLPLRSAVTVDTDLSRNLERLRESAVAVSRCSAEIKALLKTLPKQPDSTDPDNSPDAETFWNTSCDLYDSAPLPSTADPDPNIPPYNSQLTRALGWAIKAARLRHSDAMFRVGFMFGTGRGVSCDFSRAVEWYRRAALSGHSLAQFNLGMMFETGSGVPQDMGSAVEWYRRAAVAGEGAAQLCVARLLADGNGVPLDYGKALEWYRRAAEDPADEIAAIAQNNIGCMYRDGKGSDRDPGKAMEWFLRAATGGLAIAQFNVGLLFQEGLGVPRDEKLAQEWFSKAADGGFEEALRKITC